MPPSDPVGACQPSRDRVRFGRRPVAGRRRARGLCMKRVVAVAVMLCSAKATVARGAGPSTGPTTSPAAKVAAAGSAGGRPPVVGQGDGVPAGRGEGRQLGGVAVVRLLQGAEDRVDGVGVGRPAVGRGEPAGAGGGGRRQVPQGQPDRRGLRPGAADAGVAAARAGRGRAAAGRGRPGQAAGRRRHQGRRGRHVLVFRADQDGVQPQPVAVRRPGRGGGGGDGAGRAAGVLDDDRGGLGRPPGGRRRVVVHQGQPERLPRDQRHDHRRRRVAAAGPRRLARGRKRRLPRVSFPTRQSPKG